MKYYTLPPKPVPTHSLISADGNPSLPVAQAPNLELIHFFLSLSQFSQLHVRKSYWLYHQNTFRI